MSRNLKTAVQIDLEGNLPKRTKEYSDALGRMSKRGRRHVNLLGRSISSASSALDRMGGRYTAAIAGGVSAYKAKQQLDQSASLDKQLVQLAQNAGVAISATDSLRGYLFDLSKQTGRSVDDLLLGMNALIQSGQSWDEAVATIAAINPTMAVTGAAAETLAGALGVAKENFGFDLSNVDVAVVLLDKMTKSGRLGNAELENLSGIFAKVGGEAKTAGLSFEETLGLIESLSFAEPDPDRLGTLADSTLRLFTKQKYLKNAEDVTGVSFYDADGERRAAFDVLNDIAKKFRGLKSDIERDKAISAAFGQADLDTIKGLRKLLEGEALSRGQEFSEAIERSPGLIKKELAEALDNSIDQVSRLKAALREAADEFAQPVNEVLKNGIKYLLDEQGLSGKDVLAGGAAGAALLFAGAKGGSSLLNKLGGLGVGVAKGKVLEEAAGVTPVYVVNMPDSGGLGSGAMGGNKKEKRSPGRKKKVARRPGNFSVLKNMPVKYIPALGAGAMGTAGAPLVGAWLAGSAVGTGIFNLAEMTETGRKFNSIMGEGLVKLAAMLGVDEAKRTVVAREKYEAMVRLKIDSPVPVTVTEAEADGLDVDIDAGQTVGNY